MSGLQIYTYFCYTILYLLLLWLLLFLANLISDLLYLLLVCIFIPMSVISNSGFLNFTGYGIVCYIIFCVPITTTCHSCLPVAALLPRLQVYWPPSTKMQKNVIFEKGIIHFTIRKYTPNMIQMGHAKWNNIKNEKSNVTLDNIFLECLGLKAPKYYYYLC